MIHKGYDLFITNPGEKQEMNCRVCGSKCIDKRNVFGPINYSSAMARHSQEHDEFTCPHIRESWHEQALKLVQTIEETPSKRLAEIMQKDLQDLLQENLK